VRPVAAGGGDAVTGEPFTATRDELREELAADLSRGGYILLDTGGDGHYFDKYLVLARPGLLARSARLLAAMVAEDCDRLAVNGVAAATLGVALAQETGLPLLLAADDRPGTFAGELFAGSNVLLIEDVVFTGHRARGGATALRAAGAQVQGVLCLLDREAGAAQLLAAEGVALRALFTETELLRHAGRPPR
jgi:orotate phosphoribosyltransferase